MQGLITESELGQADQVFPGIAAFFAALAVKPRTFLELVTVFDHWCEAACVAIARDSSPTIAMAVMAESTPVAVADPDAATDLPCPAGTSRSAP